MPASKATRRANIEMVDWKKVLISPDVSVREAIATIDGGASQIALVVDESGRLLGTVTDGDIRRALLRGESLDAQSRAVMNVHPTVASDADSDEQILLLMRRMTLRQIPIVDGERRVVGLRVITDYLSPQRENWVVLMAGGLGTRLHPLTETCPKPMLKIGEKPILENILENFIEHGFHRFFFSVNYMANVIKEYFGDGSRWGVKIGYLDENDRLGTAGALSLLGSRPDNPLVVMNGDLLTKVNFRHLLDFHHQHHATATMCVRDYEFQVPFGVVTTDHHLIRSIDEKPVHRFFVNAGIYVLEPEALKYVPGNTFFDMPTLFERLVADKKSTVAFPIREYWLDIGRLDDYERANGEFGAAFE